MGNFKHKAKMLYFLDMMQPFLTRRPFEPSLFSFGGAGEQREKINELCKKIRVF